MVGIVLDLERDLEKSLHPLFVQEHKESLLAEEILDLHLKTEVDLDFHQSQKHVQKYIWKRRMRAMPVEHSKFIWDIVSYISNLKAIFDFAIGCGIPSHIVRKAIEANDPSDGDISLEDCVVQALTIWWISSNWPAIWKFEKIKQGFVGLYMPGIYACLIKRNPILDPSPPEPTPQNDPQPGTSGQMSPRPKRYLSLKSLALKLISTEYDFLRELSCLIQTPENTYGLVCMTNLPDETFAYIR